MNINSNNFTIYFKRDNTVKLRPWFCGRIESTFFVYLPFILRQFVTSVCCYYKLKFFLFIHFSRDARKNLFLLLLIESTRIYPQWIQMITYRKFHLYPQPFSRQMYPKTYSNFETCCMTVCACFITYVRASKN